MSTPLHIWLDAVYAAWADAPHELLQKAMKHFVVQEARLDPERARATWGLRPEHQVLNNGLGQDSGHGQAADIPNMPRGTGPRYT